MQNDNSIIQKKKRQTFSKQFKRVALIEFTKGKSPDEIFESLGCKINSNDKKYASKLLHKWRMEFYGHLRLYPVLNGKLDEKLLLYVMNNLMF